MEKQPWEREIEGNAELPLEAQGQKNSWGAGALENALDKGRFEMGRESAKIFEEDQEEGRPSRLDLFKIPKLGESNDSRISDVVENVLLGKSGEIEGLDEKERHEVLEYARNVLMWSANYMWDNYEVGIPKNLYGELQRAGDSWVNLIKFVKTAQKYSGSPRRGFLVCRLLKISQAFHEVNSHADLERIQQETQWMGRCMAENIPELEDDEEAWSADGLERETGLYVAEGTAEEKANKKKKRFVHVEQMKTKTKRKDKKGARKGRSLNVSFDDLEGTGRDFQILAAYFSTKEIERMVGKRLRKPDMTIDKVLNDGARGRIMVRPNKMQDAVAWMEKLGFAAKKNRGTISDRAEIVVTAHRLLNGRIVPGFRENGKERTLEESAVALELQIVSAGDFEKTETGEQNHKIFSVVQATQELMGDGSLSDNKMQGLMKKASRDSLDADPTKPVSEEKIRRRFEKEFFLDRDTKRWFSYEQVMRVGESEIYPREERLEILVRSVQSEVYGDNILSEVSQGDWCRLFETRELPTRLPLEACERIVMFVSAHQFGKVFREKLKVQLKARQVLENE